MKNITAIISLSLFVSCSFKNFSFDETMCADIAQHLYDYNLQNGTIEKDDTLYIQIDDISLPRFFTDNKLIVNDNIPKNENKSYLYYNIFANNILATARKHRINLSSPINLYFKKDVLFINILSFGSRYNKEEDMIYLCSGGGVTVKYKYDKRNKKYTFISITEWQI